MPNFKALVGACCVVLLVSACNDNSTKTSSKTTESATANTTQTTTTVTATPNSFTDPFSYCNAVGTVDKPDSRYTGQALPDNLLNSIIKGGSATADSPIREAGYVTWRCADKNVLVCLAGANIPCEEKADTSTTPHSGMVEFCKTEKNTDSIPAAAAGRTTVYEWSCKEGQPVKGNQVTQVDAQGYPKDWWQVVKAQ